ncbi:hypothetical protein [Actinoalloteichus hymeniacidonis]|uniref:Uncharacterized protein n=1 Tax=Actinoalloteichus hymeniacidonis TaxID=340345 RepID=A0AAC9HNJ9_9PSEU|nr:hypothetical protein [Actinoalloteichus hymeniacidonis]AOS62046.1 hypothetical protein TL08_06105 [Actinoalloteichus hymeniacidonis]MBB5909932.1 hypothetical protein [Actinoalloteichus hymeniacidonis]
MVWDEEFQATYNADVPQGSNFSSPEQEGAWLERGRRLAARIHQESPVVTSVEYRGYGATPSGAVVFSDR